MAKVVQVRTDSFVQLAGVGCDHLRRLVICPCGAASGTTETGDPGHRIEMKGSASPVGFDIVTVRRGQQPAHARYPNPGEITSTPALTPGNGNARINKVILITEQILRNAEWVKVAELADLAGAQLSSTDNRTVFACSKRDVLAPKFAVDLNPLKVLQLVCRENVEYTFRKDLDAIIGATMKVEAPE